MSYAERAIESEMKEMIMQTFNNDWIWKQHVISSLGQQICVVSKKTFSGKIALYLLTSDERLTPPVYKPIKIAQLKGDVADAKVVASRFCESVKRSPISFNFAAQPEGICVPLDRETMRVVPLPGSALYYPDSFLEHDRAMKPPVLGDEVLVQCKAFGFNFYHAGIYHRGGYVYHFMLACDMTDLCTEVNPLNHAQGAVLFDRWSDFIYALNETESKPTICRLSHVLHVRSGDEVVECARSLYFNHSQFDEYDLRDRNCQHFASFCARGVQFSFEMASNLRYLACSLLKPSGAILGSLQKIGSLPNSVLPSSCA